MKLAIKQAMAIIIIMLMSNSAFALINVNHVSGQDGLDGYRKRSDHTFMNITTDSENIRILGDEFRFFDCSEIEGLGLYYCSMDIGPDNLPAGPKTPPYKLQRSLIKPGSLIPIIFPAPSTSTMMHLRGSIGGR